MWTVYYVCPVGALREKDNTELVWEALANEDLHVVVQTAPAVRVALGEELVCLLEQSNGENGICFKTIRI